MDRELEELATDERKTKRGRPKRAENERETGKDKKLEEFWRREELRREEISYDRSGNRNVKADGEAERGKLDEGSISKRKNELKGTPKQRVTRGKLQRELNQGEEPCSPRYSLEEKKTTRRKTQRRQEIVERVEEDERSEEDERKQESQGKEESEEGARTWEKSFERKWKEK